MAETRTVRAYVDTSVFGGCFDDEYRETSQLFFDQVQAGRFKLITSALVEAELEAAPPKVRSFYALQLEHADVIDINEQAVRLQRAYIEAGVLAEKHYTDALHVALASSNQCDLVVSWNFRHIVHFEKIPMYNEVNVRLGYAPIAIHSPSEVVADED